MRRFRRHTHEPAAHSFRLAPIRLLRCAGLAFALIAAAGVGVPTPATAERGPSLHANEAPPNGDYEILVAPRGTAAAETAAARADGTRVRAERRLFRAINRAAELLAEPGATTVTIRLAAGEYPGQAGLGVWTIPTIANPEGRLRILGGYDDTFSARSPFTNLSRLVTQAGRDGAFITVDRRSQLAELVISGLHFDAAPSNNYDARSNSILKGSSRTYGLLSFNQLRVESLVVADNIFINGAHGAFDPAIGGVPGSKVEIRNNLFLNTIMPMKASAMSRGTEVDIVIQGNSFILNWPFNPDPTSSNVGAVELYHSDGYKTLTFEDNLFAFNPGGAMQQDWAPDRMGPITLRNNLFHGNGSLFSTATPEEGVIVGKFGTNPTYMSLDLIAVEDDFDYTVEGNVSMDPGITLSIAPLQAVDSDAVQRDDTFINDVRRILGMNQSGGAVPIANYAPRMVYLPEHPPLPSNPDAQRYGIQPGQVWGGR